MNPYRVSRQILPLLMVSMALAEDKPDLSNPLQRSSYAIGVDIG